VTLVDGFARPIGSHGARGDMDSEFHRQLGCHPGLSPGWVFRCHPDDEFAHILGQPRPTHS
jgi:hypothetical protein